MKDKVFSETRSLRPFEFNQEVADVFDDMLVRSIPFYEEVHRIILDMVDKLVPENGLVYDLGCSTGTTIELIDKSNQDKELSFIGIDLSEPMVEKARQKLTGMNNVELLASDLTKYEFESADFVIMNYTLQFIDKFERAKLLSKICRALKPGGILFMAEKINCEHESLHEIFTDLYYDFKRRNGYSELEISQKREALENVLTPLTPTAQIELMKYAGFDSVDMPFRWYNFASFVGVKK